MSEVLVGLPAKVRAALRRRRPARGNRPPQHGIRVPPSALRRLVVDLFTTIGTPVGDAELMADLMVATDLRCVFSHGTRQMPRYVRAILEGRVNPRPDVTVVRESDTTLVVDGDGGMGHLACHEGTRRAIEKATAHGCGVAVTGNHFHIGSAGKYTRMALESHCIGLSTSSLRQTVDAHASIWAMRNYAPISIAVPTGDSAPLVLDMGSGLLPWDGRLFRRHPGVFYKELGLASVTHALAGVLAGVHRPEVTPPASRWESDQGAFVAVFDPASFVDPDEFTSEMERYVDQASSMRPFPGHTEADLAGGPEWRWTRENLEQGIPLGAGHQRDLEGIAAELGVETSFEDHADARF